MEVFNEGSFGGQKHVGRGTAPLKTLITELNQHVSFVLPLSYFGKEGKNATGTPKGNIVVRGFIEGPPKVAKAAPPSVAPEHPAVVVAAAPAPVKATTPAAATAPAVAESVKPAAPVASEPAAKSAAPTAPAPASVAKKEPASAATAPIPLAPSADFDDTKPLKLRLTRLGVRDLKDTGGVFDKQDPALRITVGENKPFETHRYNQKLLCLSCSFYIVFHFCFIAE